MDNILQLNQKDKKNKLTTVHEKIQVNHVMSSNVISTIFDDMLDYFATYSPDCIIHTVSEQPIKGSDIYHYHRPHLEENVLPKSIITVHHDFNDTDAWLNFEKFRRPYHNACKIVCLNSNQKKWLAEHGYQKTVIIPHGYNDKFLRPKKIQPKHDNKTCLGLTSKRYGRRVKGEAVLLEIAKRLSPELFSFFLIGSGRSQEADFLRNMNFDVTIYEHLPYRLYQQFYEQIDALLILSWFEGGPACIPEAIATGTPIFSTKVGMAYDYLLPNENGFFLSRDPKIDSEILIKFATDKNFSNSLRKNSLKKNNIASTWKDIVFKYLETYQEVLKI